MHVLHLTNFYHIKLAKRKADELEDFGGGTLKDIHNVNHFLTSFRRCKNVRSPITCGRHGKGDTGC